MTQPDLRRFAWLSIAAALATILLKTWAWWLTGSVGLLSDALESLVNLAGALMALWMLTIAATIFASSRRSQWTLTNSAFYFTQSFRIIAKL